MKHAALTFLIITTALAGCLADGGSELEGTASGSPAGDNETASGANQTQAPLPNTPPIGTIDASILNGSAPVNVTFYVNATDADDDNVTWDLDADGDGEADASGTNATDTVVFAYEAPGTYNATLTLSDGTDATTANLTINLTAGTSTPPAPVVDPAGDAETDYTDILELRVAIEGENLVAHIVVADLWPTTAAMSGTVYALNVNGNGFDSFARYPIDNNPMTWDNDAGAYMASGTSSWDDGTNTVTFTIPLSYLDEEHGMTGAFEVFARTGNGTFAVDEPDDFAPNEGSVVVG